jgi:hypothetical protein
MKKTTIQDAIRTIGYSTKHTAQFDGKTYEFFKLESTGYIYVLCIESSRATRYNCEGMNGKRISMDEYLEANSQLENEASIKALDDAAEDKNVSLEEFVQQVEDWNDVQDSRNAWSAVDDVTYEVVENAVRSLNKNDKETEEIMGMIGQDAEMVMDFDEATNTLNADEFNSYIKSKLYTLLSENRTETAPEATEAHEDAKTAENTPSASKAAKKPGKATKEATKRTNKRVPKDCEFGGIYDGVDVSLTAKQVDFIKHLPDTNFWEQGLDSCIWVDILCDEIGGQFADKPMTVGAMISTLCEKGLGTRGKNRVNGHKCTSFALTELGKKVAKELGLH